MVLIFHLFKGFSDMEDFWEDLPVSRLKYSALDDFQEIFIQMVLIFLSFKDLEDFWDDLPVSRLKYNVLDDFQEVFQATSFSVVWTSISIVWTSWKSSRLPGSRLDFLEVF
ncbi:hypothetical protein F2Q69_00002737 [Brassica cretica]|uniref:Uncharacterized protein n=1 Tax=Brassica cretica TaxID=69181 RepID=A0A8S9P7G0_BRACR|nr:hypothetical protein F2Q69_00002737 [Brassica cretica]